jgi:hypothetical protein
MSTDSTYDDVPECPVCGAYLSDAWEYGFDDGKEFEWECKNGHTLKSRVSILVSYFTEESNAA